MAPLKYHRFKGGERCEECGARQWYSQDALRYCRNGHRLEGFAEHEADEDAFGNTGRVSRKKKERRQKVAVKLSGDEGQELYLEALQLVLLKQVWWLIHEKGFPQDFEEIVRALWSLRVRNLPLRESGNGSRRRNAESNEDTEGWASSAGLFSSQSEMSGVESSDVDFSDATTANWAPDPSRRWKLPKLVDTLALCYLGCLVRRLPITTADFCNWAQKGDIEYLAARNCIPRNVLDRLPPRHHSALQTKDRVYPTRLQAAVKELIISYRVNFDTIFPPLNYPPILAKFITELTLPIEVYLTVKCLAEILDRDYSYPTGGKRIRTMDNPEVLLISLVVVSAKLLYPLDGVERPPRTHQDPRIMKFDWVKWQGVTSDESAPATTTGLPRGEEYKVTPEDVLTMDKEKLDDYMDWFEKMWTGTSDLKTEERIREPFEAQKRVSAPRNLDQQLVDQEETKRIKDRYQDLHSSITTVEPVPDDEDQEIENKEKQDRDFLPVWRTEEDLPDAANGFYKKAASLAVIPLDTLLRGAVQVERQLEVWCAQKERRERDKGKGKAFLSGNESDD
ncbi:hypothetical protein M426DRAFT_324563 [Hypoxylon sp. CI-4A]|nr:hypothetical protein M426DRAFT_324563 [Hypoxylon sp. CI-4A]